ncbi:hypothetical protein ACFX14_027809 [Malus domestica]
MEFNFNTNKAEAECREATVARKTDPRLEATEQIIAVTDTFLSAESQINNQIQQPDWYAILLLAQYTQNLEIVVTQYRRLALLLNPHRNRFPYADYAFRLVSEAWNVLSNPTKKAMYDHELSMFNRFNSPPSGSTQMFERQYYWFISRYYRWTKTHWISVKISFFPKTDIIGDISPILSAIFRR